MGYTYNSINRKIFTVHVIENLFESLKELVTSIVLQSEFLLFTYESVVVLLSDMHYKLKASFNS